MDTISNPSSSFSSSPRSFSAALVAAARFWETWRWAYNGVLLIVALTWGLATWPHFRGALQPVHLLQLMLLALLANVCYSSAYVVDVPLQASAFAARWTRWRWVLWVTGMLFAVVLEWYWIGDEISSNFH